MKNLFLLITTLFFLTGCKAQNTPAPIISKDILHLQYGTSKQNTLDLFLPKTYSEKTPVIILLHGGAWMIGGKEYTDKTAKDLRDRGFIIANVDYRYVSETVHGRDLLMDIDRAVTFVQKQAKEHHFSTTGYIMSGISAGAHLALLYGYTTPKSIKSIAVLCPPIQLDDPRRLADMQKHDLVKNIELLADATYVLGRQPNAKFTNVSPYAHIKQIPTLLFHGDKDALVPYSHSAFMYESLQAKGVPSKLVTMTGKGHDCGMNDADTEKQVLDEITNWVTQYNN